MLLTKYLNTCMNQSVKNAGVAFVKGAYERNDYFEKNKQTAIYDEQVWTNKVKDYQSQDYQSYIIPILYINIRDKLNSVVYHCANRTV